MTTVLPPNGHALIDINLFLSANVFKYTPLRVSVPKNKILPTQPEVVIHKKVKIEVFVLDIAFKLG